jgi:hypothetical protein
MAQLGLSARERRMIGSSERKAWFGALSVLLLLIRLVVAGAAVEAAGLAGAQPSQAVMTQNCASPAHGDEAPDGRSDHADCCLLCRAAARADMAFTAPLQARAPRAPTSASRAPVLAAATRPRPIGWTSSWSSRAPPLFS